MSEVVYQSFKIITEEKFYALVFCTLFLFIIYISLTRIYSFFHWKSKLKESHKSSHSSKEKTSNQLGENKKNWVPSPFHEAYKILHWPMSSDQYLVLLGLMSLLVSFISFRFNFLLFITLLIGPIIFMTGYAFIKLKAQEQRKKLIEQIPLFMQSLSNALQAGFALPQALKFIAQEITPPLKPEIQALNAQLDLQIPLPKALQDFSQKLKHPDITFVCESTIIQLKTGGNLIQLFQKTAQIIEEKLKLERDIKSFTSQGKMSGILMAGLWPLSLLVFNWMSPAHTAVLFETTPGKTLLVTSLLLEFIGFWFIWKIVKVKI